MKEIELTTAQKIAHLIVDSGVDHLEDITIAIPAPLFKVFRDEAIEGIARATFIGDEPVPEHVRILESGYLAFQDDVGRKIAFVCPDFKLTLADLSK